MRKIISIVSVSAVFMAALVSAQTTDHNVDNIFDSTLTLTPTPTPMPTSTTTFTPDPTPTPTPTPVSVTNSYLNVMTIDNQGRIVPYVGIVIDTVVDTSIVATNTEANFWKTDSGGQVHIPIRSGTYIVRAFLPPDHGYINPTEQKIILNTGEAKDIKLVFIKKETVFALYIKGITRLEDGSPTDAFIWAWSEKGRTTSMRSGTDGTFSLQISPDDKWHIGAGRIINDIPYRSSEIIVPVTDQAVSIELILSGSKDELLSLATNTKPSDQIITTRVQDGAGVIVPANAVTTIDSLTVEIKPTLDVPYQPSAKVFGNAYDIRVKNSSGFEFSQFAKEIEVELPYDPSLLASQNLTEEKMIPSYYDESTGTWVRITNYTIDKTRNVIIARVNHLTIFAIVFAADIVPPNPSSPAQSLIDGDMISATGSSDPDIYIVNGSNFKRLFLNPVIFSFYGHLGSFANVKSVTSTARDSYKTSGLFRNCETNDPRVYGVEITGEDTGVLRWVNTTGEQAVADDPDFFKKVFCINNNEFNWYPKGSNYSSVNQIPDYSR